MKQDEAGMDKEMTGIGASRSHNSKTATALCRAACFACVSSSVLVSFAGVTPGFSASDMRLLWVAAATIVLGTACLIATGSTVRPSVVDAAVFLWHAYFMGRSVVCNPYPCASQCLCAARALALYSAMRMLFAASVPPDALVMVPFVAAGAAETCLGAASLLTGHGGKGFYLVTGTFGNPGPYSAILAMALVMSCVAYRRVNEIPHPFRKPFRMFVIFCAAVTAMVLPSTMSRAAIIAAALCLALAWKDKLTRRSWILAIPVAAAVIGMYLLKRGSADGRLFIFLMSLRCVSRRPLLGWGTGGFFHAYSTETAELCRRSPDAWFGSADVLEYAFDDIMKVAVEQGVTGAVLAIAAALLVFRRLGGSHSALGMGMLCLALFSCFSYPLELLPYQSAAAVIAAFAGTRKPAPNGRKARRLLAAAANITMAASLLLAVIFIGRETGLRAKASRNASLISGSCNSAFNNERYAMLPLMTGDRAFLFHFSKALMEQGRWRDAAAMARKGTQVSNDPVFHYIIGECLINEEDMEGVENAFVTAHQTMPNRIYPLYRLMTLYSGQGMETDAIRMARMVIDAVPKVDSPAVKEMKEEAGRILKRNSNHENQ